KLVADRLANFHVGLADEIVGGREAGEVGHGFQVPDDDAWVHAARSVTQRLAAKKDARGYRPNVRSWEGRMGNDVNGPEPRAGQRRPRHQGAAGLARAQKPPSWHRTGSKTLHDWYWSARRVRPLVSGEHLARPFLIRHQRFNWSGGDHVDPSHAIRVGRFDRDCLLIGIMRLHRPAGAP